jgi:flagellum-specific ATP synthase
VDVLGSISRVASKVNPKDRTAVAAVLRKTLAARRNAQDLIDVGAYHRGTNPLVDAALDNEAAINSFLQQRMDDSTPHHASWQALSALTARLGATLEGAA